MPSKTSLVLLCCVITLAGVATLPSCTRQSAERERSLAIAGEAFGSTYHVTVHPLPDPEAQALLRQQIDALFERIDSQMSTYSPSSEISRFNALPAGTSMPIGPEFAEVLGIALQIAEATGGAYDPAVGALSKAWGFGPGGVKGTVPDEPVIDAAMAVSGRDGIALSGRKLTKKTGGVLLDLDSIAPGYAADLIAGHLTGGGYPNHMVEVGGEIMAHGLNAGGEAWSIGIELPGFRPDDPQAPRQLRALVPVRDQGLATSGDYRNYFEAHGQVFPHFIDPRDGKPVRNQVASVTVLAPSAALADAAATACCVLGEEKGLLFLQVQSFEGQFMIRQPDGTFREAHTPGFPIAAPR